MLSSFTFILRPPFEGTLGLLITQCTVLLTSSLHIVLILNILCSINLRYRAYCIALYFIIAQLDGCNYLVGLPWEQPAAHCLVDSTQLYHLSRHIHNRQTHRHSHHNTSQQIEPTEFEQYWPRDKSGWVWSDMVTSACWRPHVSTATDDSWPTCVLVN